MIVQVLLFVYGLIAYVIGVSSLVYGVGFLANAVVPKGIDTGEVGSPGQSVLVNMILLLLLPLQHSLMARPGFKTIWTRVVSQAIDQCLTEIAASVGADSGGQLLNVNADTLAGHLAGRLGAARLLIAGGTAGVLDKQGLTIPSMDVDMMHRLIADGRASAGMVAKLIACREAHRAGVGRIDIVTGTHTDNLDTSAGTTIQQVAQERAPVSPSPAGRAR